MAITTTKHTSLKVTNKSVETDASRQHSSCSVINVKDENPKYQYSFFFVLVITTLP